MVPVGVPPTINRHEWLAADRLPSNVNRLAETEALLDLITPWSGHVPEGYVVDSLGVLTDGSYLPSGTGPSSARHETTKRPSVATWGEGFFELADWLLAARDARDRFVAVSLGAAWGAQLVGAFKALQAINPLPCRLVAIEPVFENCTWIRQHMAANGIDAREHIIIQAAVGYDNEPVLFPITTPGVSASCGFVNSAESRAGYALMLRTIGRAEDVLDNILLYNSTGLGYDLDSINRGELRLVSAVTLQDVLMPFDRVDLFEADIQGSEAYAIPPYMDVLQRKVSRVHIGTHGRKNHELLRALFLNAGWDVVFDFAPDSKHMTEGGVLELGDGILSARNPTI
jgi:hypothetical protein